MANFRTGALKASLVSFLAGALFALPVFAFAQVYGGGTYGSSGVYGTGEVQVTVSPVTVSSGGGGVISGPNSIGYVNNGTSTPAATTNVGLPPSTPTTSLTEAQIQSIISILQSFGADQSVIDSVNASLHNKSSSTAANKGMFTRDLEWGVEGEDVRALQQYLNAHGFLLANYGVGSIGHETTYFGDATKYQLIQFQKVNNITPAAGYFGPKTRAFITK